MQAGQQTASKVMLTVLQNIELADEKDMLVCQDTGLPVYKLLVGNRFPLDLTEVKHRLRIACEPATNHYPLRSTSVHPLTRKNTQTNTGEGIPVTKVDYVPNSYTLEIQIA